MDPLAVEKQIINCRFISFIVILRIFKTWKNLIISSFVSISHSFFNHHDYIIFIRIKDDTLYDDRIVSLKTILISTTYWEKEIPTSRSSPFFTLDLFSLLYPFVKYVCMYVVDKQTYILTFKINPRMARIIIILRFTTV